MRQALKPGTELALPLITRIFHHSLTETLCTQLPLLLLWGLKDPWITPAKVRVVGPQTLNAAPAYREEEGSSVLVQVAEWNFY